eukprot:622492-Hanusia_phi.AAC.1
MRQLFRKKAPEGSTHTCHKIVLLKHLTGSRAILKRLELGLGCRDWSRSASGSQRYDSRHDGSPRPCVPPAS